MCIQVHFTFLRIFYAVKNVVTLKSSENSGGVIVNTQNPEKKFLK